MRKFLAVVKREYVQRVRSKMFIFMTILAPLLMAFFGVVPALIFSIKAGGPAKIALVDQTGKMFDQLQTALAGGETGTAKATDLQNRDPDDRFQSLSAMAGSNVELENVPVEGINLEQITRELNARIQSKEISGYLLLPPNLLDGGKAAFFGRNTGDVFTKRLLQGALTRAVREQRLKEANIDAKTIAALSQPVQLEMLKAGTSGERDSGEGFVLVFAAGFVMYLTILMYGQVILGAVIEEKETRIAEILFSSVRPFTLMLGKLVGVSLVALTQLAIWGLAFGAFALYGVNVLASRGMPVHVPHIPSIHFLYFGLFFLLGYFIYATLYALVGSMVTTAQEGGQLAMPIVLILVIGFYLFLPVSRSPDSSFAFWVSMFPFFSPVTMMVRIVTQTPPFWQIALSLGLGFGSVLLITWFASRIYRIGMLMYGKRASIPEAWRWMRQA